MMRTRRGNPDIPLCLLSSMRVGAIASTLRAETASRWVAPELGDARAVELWLKLNVRIVTIPCALPDAWPLAASLAPRWQPEPCDNCELAMRGLRERQPPHSGRLIQMTAGMRHSRFTKVRAAAHTPFDVTLILDADAAVCADGQLPIQGVVDYMRLVNASIGMRYFGHSIKRPTGKCDDVCASKSHGPAREHLLCLSLCVNAANSDCHGNPASMLVRKSAQAIWFARNWYARYMHMIFVKHQHSEQLSDFAESHDQQCLGSQGLPSKEHRTVCRGVVNLPFNMHMGCNEVAQGQWNVRGRVVVVHGGCLRGCMRGECLTGKEARGRQEDVCPMFTSCCTG
eukprot:CAMPEP_0179984844 /NCGR_PEP_ID=MMETSP0984-20121128/1356_1 /TAXON_ID=483367 /ORGANISM="non described non described, Strain CCMP 2436" /LENGTH=340 /DNA_ID=CAMNT_0021903471 /DNA_START=85 /DNA_END=1104 /DNA_ORIENTATION=-